MRFRVLVGLIAAAVVPSLAAAQQQDTSSTIDRIVAIVGNRAILVTELQEQALISLRDRQLPADPKVRASFFRTLLDQIVGEELVVQEAQRDTAIKVTDEEVTQAVNETFRNARSKYTSEEAFRADLQKSGFQTIEEWRSFTTDQQRREFLRQRFWDRLRSGGKLKPLPPTDAEVRDYYDQNKATFRPQSEGVSFRQIVIAPHPSDSARSVALAQADSILQEIRKGADFATAAKRFSMDPATKEQGGSLNWIRRGQGWDPRFEDAAFSLRPGQVSDPVESAFGFHLIQVERTQPAEVSVRHILIMPVIDSIRADSARLRAEEVFAAAKAGASFDSLQRLYHDKLEERDATQVPLDRLNQISPSYSTAIRDVKQGELAPLFRLESPDPHRAKYVVLQVTARIPAGEVRFEDVRDQIRNSLGRILAERRFIQRLKKTTFVEIRDI